MNLPIPLLAQLEGLTCFSDESFNAAHQLLPPTSIRLHPIKGMQVPLKDTTPIPWCSAGYYLPERPLFTADPFLHAGGYYVQEASSMFLDRVLRHLYPDPAHLRVLDLCAAPGGKSTLLASHLSASSLLISNDVIRTRAAILEENMTRWGYSNTWVTSNDPRDFGRIADYFDLIVVDAPCSGSGLFRKDQRALSEWSAANVQLCSERQQRILADVYPALKKDGYLVYATCSYSPAEDEEILDFLADHFAVVSMPIPIDEAWGIEAVQSPKHQLQAYRFFPDKLKGEGFFIAVLQKKDGAESFQYPRFRSVHHKKIAEQTQHLLAQEDYHCIENDRGLYSAIKAQHEPDFHLLRSYVYLRRAGTLLGSPTAKEWIPEHDIALSVDRHPQLSCIDVDLENALLFLKKDQFNLPEQTSKGWHIVRYQGQGLGWIKALGNRVNNYLPKNWRIRMDIDFDALQ